MRLLEAIERTADADTPCEVRRDEVRRAAPQAQRSDMLD